MKIQAARRGRAAGRHRRPRELRPEPRERQQQLPAAHRRGAATSAATARTSSAPAGASTPTSATPTRTCCSRRPTRAARGSATSSTSTTRRHPEPRRQLLPVGQPLSNIQSQNQVGPARSPLFGQWVDPRLEQPYTMQTNVGWSHELTANTVLSVDYVNSIGRDLNFRPRVNQRIPATDDPPHVRRCCRRRSARTPTPPARRSAAAASEYNALILSVRRRLSQRRRLHGVLHAVEGQEHHRQRVRRAEHREHPGSRTIRSTIRVQFGPNRTTDARHRISLSAVFQLPGGFHVAPIFFYPLGAAGLSDRRPRSQPRRRRDGDPGAGVRGRPASTRTPASSTIKEIGACETVNCGRGWAQSQMNLRVSKTFRLGGRARHRGDRRDLQPVQRHQPGQRDRRSTAA